MKSDVQPQGAIDDHTSALRADEPAFAAEIIEDRSGVAAVQLKKRLLAERSEALSALRDSEERFRSAFDHAAIGMALVALDGRWLQVNRSLCRIVGYTEHELLVRDYQSITHPQDLDADLAHVRRLITGEVRDYHMVKRYFHRQGHVVWVLLSVSLVRDADGRPLHFIAQIQDITRRKEAEDALRASEEEYRATFEMDGVGKAQVDLETGRFIRVNPKLCDIVGYPAEELLTRTFTQITHPDDLAASSEACARMRRGELPNYSSEKRYIHKDGRVVWISLNATLIRSNDGLPARAVATVQDVTERKLAERLERDRRRILEMVARDMPLPEVLDQLASAMEQQVVGSTAAVFVLQDGEVHLHGPALAREWRDELQARSLTLAAGLAANVWGSADHCGVSLLDRDEVWTPFRSAAHRHGIVACWTIAIQATDRSTLGLLTVFCDEMRRPFASELQTLDMVAQLAAICIEHHNTTRRLGHLVRHDPLTGLPNRLLFEDRLQHALSFAGRSGNRVALLVLDIDKFKSVNDCFGHQAGDHLLQHFAQRLRGKLRQTDTMARIGGDEFVIVLPELKAREHASLVAGKLVDSLVEPFEIAGRTIRATTSIGIATFPEDGSDAVTLQKQADDALYRVKERGRNGYGY